MPTTKPLIGVICLDSIKVCHCSLNHGSKLYWRTPSSTFRPVRLQMEEVSRQALNLVAPAEFATVESKVNDYRHQIPLDDHVLDSVPQSYETRCARVGK